MKNCFLFLIILVLESCSTLPSNKGADLFGINQKMDTIPATSNVNSEVCLELFEIYKGKNIYIQNPFSNNNPIEFCITKVLVNGKPMKDHKSNAFEIDLSVYNKSDCVKIEIFHKNHCLPKILNPIPTYPKKVTFQSIEIIQR